MPNHLPCLSLPLLDKAHESIVPTSSSRVQNCLAIPWTSWYTSSVFHALRTEKADGNDPFSVSGKIRSSYKKEEMAWRFLSVALLQRYWG